MKKTKLFKALSSFSAVDLNRFEKFVKSPYFNSDKRLTTLLSVLSDAVKSKELQNLQKDEVWDLVFANEVFDDKKLRNISSRLLLLLEEFMIQEELKTKPMTGANLLLSAIDSRDSHELQNIAVSRAQKLASNYPYKSSDYYYDLYELEKRLYHLSKLEVSRIKKNVGKRFNLDKIIQNLKLFYYGEKLKYQCSVLGWQKILSSDTSIEDVEATIELIKSQQELHTPHILIYKYIYLTLKDPDDDNSFIKLVEQVRYHLQYFPNREAKNILDSATNYCLRKINKGDTSYIHTLFELYTKAIREQSIIVNEEITPWTYKNIVSVGLRLSKFKWTNEFIEEYSSYLPKEYRSSGRALAKAQLAFYKQEYSNALLHLQSVDFQEYSYITSVRTILIATYYELDEYELVDSAALSFRKFINRQKHLTRSQRASFNHYINFTLKLIKPSNHRAEVLLELKKDIINTQGLASKSWLLEKVDDLLGLPKNNSNQ